MRIWYRLAADGIMLIHVGYVAFVIGGLLAVLVGWARGWKWTQNTPFRVLHLLAIAIVVGESCCEVACPLTTWEQSLRTLAGESSYRGDFIANCVHDLLFFEAEPWVFTACYTLFGLAVLLTFVLHPPRICGKVRRKGTSPIKGSQVER